MSNAQSRFTQFCGNPRLSSLESVCGTPGASCDSGWAKAATLTVKRIGYAPPSVTSRSVKNPATIPMKNPIMRIL